MTYDRLMIRFGELSTKGKNKKDFITQLARNIKHALKEYSLLTYEVLYDHIYVILNGEDETKVIERLQDVSGIFGISPVVKVESNVDIIIDKCFELIHDFEGKTFKIQCKRGDKSFPMKSDDIIRKVATKILKETQLKVDVHNPDILLAIDVRSEGTYIYHDTIPGLGGYPLGVGGKVMLMLSGGIDSPVAAYYLMKRGLKIECIHYASPPYTQEGVIQKIKDLLKVLTRYQAEIRLTIIPFTKLQEAIYDNTKDGYEITIMRRMMYRIGERLAKMRNCHAIANGESVGQVASQTLQSIETINAVTSFPVIRPLAIFDKVEIIKVSKKIGTYDISIRPYEDCCTIFEVKKPKTMPDIKEAEAFETKFNYEDMIYDCIKNRETIIIKEGEDDNPQFL